MLCKKFYHFFITTIHIIETSFFFLFIQERHFLAEAFKRDKDSKEQNNFDNVPKFGVITKSYKLDSYMKKSVKLPAKINF